jgi:hypothetical protein
MRVLRVKGEPLIRYLESTVNLKKLLLLGYRCCCEPDAPSYRYPVTI